MTGAFPVDQFSRIPRQRGRRAVDDHGKGIHASGTPRVRGNRSSGDILVHPRPLALNLLAQLVLRIRSRCSEPRRQTVEFCRVGQVFLKRFADARSQALEIESVRDAAFDTNELALVLQQPLVARRTGHAGIVAGRPALDLRRNIGLADTDRQTVRVSGAGGLRDEAVARAVQAIAKKVLAVRGFHIQKKVI